MTNTIKGLMVVAHPDDCIIFGWPFVRLYGNVNWKILYLTYTDISHRGAEIKNFWQHYNITVDFCGIEDHYRDLEADKIITFDTDSAANILKTKITNCDFLLTHGSDGEYGHPHHKFVHNVCTTINLPQAYFANRHANFRIDHEQYNFDKQNLQLVPEHRNVIESFSNRYQGLYWLSEQTKELLKGLES